MLDAVDDDVRETVPVTDAVAADVDVSVREPVDVAELEKVAVSVREPVEVAEDFATLEYDAVAVRVADPVAVAVPDTVAVAVNVVSSTRRMAWPSDCEVMGGGRTGAVFMSTNKPPASPPPSPHNEKKGPVRINRSARRAEEPCHWAHAIHKAPPHFHPRNDSKNKTREVELANARVVTVRLKAGVRGERSAGGRGYKEIRRSGSPCTPKSRLDQVRGCLPSARSQL